MMHSQMLELGTLAPTFWLPDPDGQLHSLEDRADAKAYLVMFICNHCPFVKLVADELSRLGQEYQARGVYVIGINSNDVEKYPDDSPAMMKAEAQRRGYTFPYVLDAEQSVAKAYRAACTPDFYAFGADRRLIYRGQLDNSRPGNGVDPDGADLRRALEAQLAGEPVPTEQIPGMGCSIKWKPGNAPGYFG